MGKQAPVRYRAETWEEESEGGVEGEEKSSWPAREGNGSCGKKREKSWWPEEVSAQVNRDFFIL
jgi:hypothetical protein